MEERERRMEERENKPSSESLFSGNGSNKKISKDILIVEAKEEEEEGMKEVLVHQFI